MLSLLELLPVVLLILMLAAAAVALHHVHNHSPRDEDEQHVGEPPQNEPPLHEPPEEPEAQPVLEDVAPAARHRRRTAMFRARRQAAMEQAATDPQPDFEREAIKRAAGAASSGRRNRKKDANREAKREAQAARVAAVEAARERAVEEEEARAAADEAENETVAAAAEEEEKKREEQEKKEREEYESWKHLISVEDAGETAVKHLEEDPHLLGKFCNYVRDTKVVVLEELAAEFDMSTEETVDRLTRLEENGTLSGFFDDRGKFVYVSSEEMKDVANFIRKRGRVSIVEIAAESTRLLRLDSTMEA